MCSLDDARTGTRREPRYEGGPPWVAALGSDEARVLESIRFGVQKSVGRIRGRDACEG